jgi:hypothetical protein
MSQLSRKSGAAAGIHATIFSNDKIVIGGDFLNVNTAVGVSDGLNDTYETATTR